MRAWHAVVLALACSALSAATAVLLIDEGGESATPRPSSESPSRSELSELSELSESIRALQSSIASLRVPSEVNEARPAITESFRVHETLRKLTDAIEVLTSRMDHQVDHPPLTRDQVLTAWPTDKAAMEALLLSPPDQIRQRFGEPESVNGSGSSVYWSYPWGTVLFVRGSLSGIKRPQ